ncbi:hypothetical protein EW146_g6237 [Bondarzewia mesenterica]|uniref:Golgi to ER traffic protein 2 n=1 Tax=Bondarzewia mesenterica TaxID=1095465 RepID=A0A4S4LP77_9AGAM|nr:hypothetical protein EW146_g6237 [Bondarzewia mesenterica]
MSTAAARAEARRKAILNRGADRLTKLTTSARGEDAPAFVHDDPPLPSFANVPNTNLENFLGEDTPRPSPPVATRSSRATPDPHTSPFEAFGMGGTPPDPSVWSAEQQQQFIQAVLGSGPMPTALPSNPQIASPSNNVPLPDDPLMTLMSSLGQGGPSALGKGPMAPPNPSEKPRSLVQKLMPLIHVLTAWFLVAFFVAWKEPEVFYAQTSSAVLPGSIWRRWATLGKRQVTDVAWGVQVVPFFWAFVSLELMLFSLRIFSGFNKTQPPILLALALPHLPEPFPTIIVHGLQYIQMAGTLFDDLAAVVVALGLLVALSGWIVDL